MFSRGSITRLRFLRFQDSLIGLISLKGLNSQRGLMWKRIFILVLVFIILTGCSPQNDIVATQTSISPTTTFTPKPPASQLPTKTPTLTPVATLSSEDALETFTKLLEENNGCQLPCLWGIIPGKTTWTEIEPIFSAMGEIISFNLQNKITSHQICIPRCTSTEPILEGHSVQIYTKNELVIGIITNTDEINTEPTLDNLLTKFGEPEEIWIRPVLTSIDGQPYYNLMLFYKANGILIIIGIENAYKSGDFLEICPQKLFTRTPYHIIPFLLFDSNIEIDFLEIENEILGKPHFWTLNKYSRLEDISLGFTNEDFFNRYSQPDSNQCFKVDPEK